MFGHAPAMFLSYAGAGARLDAHGGLGIKIDQLIEAIADADAFLAVGTALQRSVDHSSDLLDALDDMADAFQCARTSPHEPGTALLCERDAFALALADDKALELREWR